MKKDNLQMIAPQKEVCEAHYNNLDNYCQKLADKAASMFGIPVWAIFAITRWRRCVDARKAVAVILREKTDKTLTEISTVISWAGADHTTVLHAINTGDDLFRTDDGFRTKVFILMDVINDIKTIETIKETLAMRKVKVASLTFAMNR